MRHPGRAPLRLRSAAAATPLLLLSLLAPATAAADRETPRAVSRERGPEARAAAPARPSQPAARVSAPNTPRDSASGSAARVPDDRRGDRRHRAESRQRGGGRYYYPRYYDGWYGGGWGFWGSMLFGYYGYPWIDHGPYYGARYGYRGADDDWGALDLDVSPAKTEVYLDGQYLGRVDAFDGFPQYLWLEEGTYDLALFREGYKTIARQVTVLPGVVISVDHNLEPGESVRPVDLAAKTHERRNRRLRYDREARERAEEMEREERRDAEEDERGAERGDSADERDADRAPRQRGGGDVGRVQLEVEPDDASVYLDGRFLGTGSEIARLHSGLILDRGAHRISVVRPGYRSRDLEFEVREGEELELEVRLEPGD